MAGKEKTKNEEPKQDVQYSEDEVKAIQEDISKAKSSLVSKETDDQIAKAKEQARLEAEKEFTTNQKIQELKAENERIQSEKLEKEKEFADKFSQMNEKINEMIGSKQPVVPENPFKGNQSTGPNQVNVESLSDDAVNAIEEKSAELFFGEDPRLKN